VPNGYPRASAVNRVRPVGLDGPAPPAPDAPVLSRLVQSHFRVEVTGDDALTVVTVSGELDLASSPALQEELERLSAAGGGRVIIDLRGIEFMDSTGLSALVRAQGQLEQAGRPLGIVPGTQQVQRLLELTGVAERLEFADPPEESGPPEL
jgi:anti-sigma B factor antagonist